MNTPAETDSRPARGKGRWLKYVSVVLVPLLLILCLARFFSKERTVTVRVIGLSDASRSNDFREAMQRVPELKLVSVDDLKAIATLGYNPLVRAGKSNPKPEDLAPEKMIQLIDNLVGKASNRSFAVAPPTGIAEGRLAKVEIKVGLNDCKGCRYGAYLAIASINGVERASVISNSRTLSTLTAWIDPTKTGKEALVTALKGAGVTLKETRVKPQDK